LYTPLPFIKPPIFPASKHKIQNNSRKQANTQQSWSILIMIPRRPPLPDPINTPQVQNHAIKQSKACNNSETPRGEQGDIITEVEQGRSDGA
jgi:hypothetical protein